MIPTLLICIPFDVVSYSPCGSSAVCVFKQFSHKNFSASRHLPATAKKRMKSPEGALL